MLEALGAIDADAARVLPPPTARAALDPEVVADAAVRARRRPRDCIEVVDDVARGGRRCAIDVTPADGQVVVTGSLYVVGPARAVLVD